MKVKCGNCKKYIEKTEALHNKISYFCDSNCLSEKSFGSSPKPKKPLKSKAKKSESDVPEEVRQHVLTGDNYRCRLCGKQSWNLVFHHVIYKSNKKNKPWQDTVSNGITLCNEPCHLSIVHKNKEKFEPLCLGIIWLREVHEDRTTTIYQLEKRLVNEN